ncbi:hypothetical protein D1872_178950 [compost metagenome]
MKRIWIYLLEALAFIVGWFAFGKTLVYTVREATEPQLAIFDQLSTHDGAVALTITFLGFMLILGFPLSYVLLWLHRWDKKLEIERLKKYGVIGEAIHGTRI